MIWQIDKVRAKWLFRFMRWKESWRQWVIAGSCAFFDSEGMTYVRGQALRALLAKKTAGFGVQSLYRTGAPEEIRTPDP